MQTTGIANENEIQAQHTKKIRLTVLGVAKEPILEHYLDKGFAMYNEMLVNKEKPVVQIEPETVLSKQMLLLHDNAHLRVSTYI